MNDDGCWVVGLFGLFGLFGCLVVWMLNDDEFGMNFALSILTVPSANASVSPPSASDAAHDRSCSRECTCTEKFPHEQQSRNFLLIKFSQQTTG